MADESEFDTPDTERTEKEVPTPTITAEQWKATGDELYRSKNYPKAIQAYTSAIENQIGLNANFYTNRSAAYLMTGSYQEALRDCDTALNIEPNNPKIYFRKVNESNFIILQC